MLPATYMKNKTITIDNIRKIASDKSRTLKQKKSSGEVGKRTNSGANFKINLFNINIGITVCI